MTSVEESTIADRGEGLLLQDALIRDHISAEDVLLVSVGGNDVALQPTLRTAVNMLMLTRSPQWLIRAGVAPGFGYFMTLFRDRIQALVQRVTAKQCPRKVVVCMLYYLDEKQGGSWADPTLELLGYNADPSTLQLIIRTLFSKIAARGFDGPAVVEPFALFEVLDGKDTSDYHHRVEPSIKGGRKMAEALLPVLLG